MVEAVIFDMDGLLIDSEPFWREAVAGAFLTVGIELNESDLRSTMGMRIDEVVAHWHHTRPWQGKSQKDIEALIVDKVIELVKRDGELRPGARATIERLAERKIKMAIASSSFMEVIDAVVDSLEIRNYFELVHSAEHETHGKPHPGVFITTSNQLKVPPHKCLVFEDSPTGVLAAKAAKMICIAVPEAESKNHPYVLTADKVIESLEDFNEEMLRSLH